MIVGGGFAGLFAARALRRTPVAVTLIDQAQHHLFQPLLYQCATGILSEGKIASPLREVFKHYRNVECVLAEVTGLDPAARRVTARRPLGEPAEFGYDWLILAAGVQQSYFGHDEYARFAPASADQCVDQPFRSGAGAVEGDDQDRRGGRLVNEHPSRPDEVATNHRRQAHRHKHSHPQGDRNYPHDGLHADTNDDPQCDPRDQL